MYEKFCLDIYVYVFTFILLSINKSSVYSSHISYRLMMSDGKVYAFGSNEFGQCGVGEGGADAILKPTLVNLPQSAGIEN